MAELSAPPWATPLVGFRSKKAAQLCAYFAMKSEGTIEKLKLIKLLYFAERQFLSENHHPMLFDEYYSLPHGPICSSALNGIDGIIHEEIWDNYIARNGNIVVAIKSLTRDEMDEVSDAELSVVDEIWKQFGRMTPSQLRNYSHKNCPEYTETKGRIAISYKQILRAVGVEDPDVVANDIEEMIDLDVTLSD
ncbi:MAG: SocA family protein [Proteobacteria bacterium]|nr:SocA family protein [Pseudomonadota bacterium]